MIYHVFVYCFMNPFSADIDECSTAIGGCADICANLPGSFRCECYHGYQLTNSTHCEGTNDAKHLGMHTHTCKRTHWPHARTHTDINECLMLNGGCHQICTNTEGSYSCSCEDGFTLNLENNKTCEGKE